MAIDPKKIAGMLIVGKKDPEGDDSGDDESKDDSESCTEGQKSAAEEFLAATHDHDPEGVVSALKNLLDLIDDDSKSSDDGE